ncbi:P1 family peptidase [Yunchengibacter salinarum]|uniref:P1 family peptidase n=1 Tax=Yunchengibacter salinarum TaxID=3133399 RepID=UPI0035B575A2
MTDRFTDLEGLMLGHAVDGHVRTGVTVIRPDSPAAMAVDVRGGGPGTRETDALRPDCLVDRFHGLVLAGGSVFGLAAADAVAARLSADGYGLDVGPKIVPVVPAAILFDLKNGGDKEWGVTSPYARLGEAAYDALGRDCPHGRVGAGFGATAGRRRGGLGTACLKGPGGFKMAALVAVNSFGDVTDQAGGDPVTLGQVPLPKLGILGGNTTLAAVATDLDLTKAQCQRLATMAHDGLARAIRPLHTPYDGDSVFALSLGSMAPAEPLATTLAVAGTLAADALVMAVRRAVADDSGAE